MTEYPEGWEEWAAFLAAQLPEPVQQETGPGGATCFVAGDPPEILVRLSASSVTVSVYLLDPADEGPRPRRLGMIVWRRLSSSQAIALVAGLIRGAHDLHVATYRECQYCERRKPPEQMQDAETCLACAVAAGDE
jgi:hypothetical protein